MRKKIIIRSTSQSARYAREKELAATLNGKSIASLKPGELQTLIEYMAWRLNLIDEQGLLAIPQAGQSQSAP